MAEVLFGDKAGNQLIVSADKTQVYGLKGNDTLRRAFNRRFGRRQLDHDGRRRHVERRQGQ